MTARTCAACDCELDATAIKVKLGGNTVEACCEVRAGPQRGRCVDLDRRAWQED